jgi:hydrogenase maturation protease
VKSSGSPGEFCGDKSQWSPVAIVGAGNWLISYDCIGPKILKLCRKTFGPEVGLIDAGTSGLNLFDRIDKQELMLIVDACRGKDPAGQVQVIEPDLQSQSPIGFTSHQISAVETLMVAKCLCPEKLPRKILLVLVETNGLDEEDGDVMETIYRNVIAVLTDEVSKWRAGCANL